LLWMEGFEGRKSKASCGRFARPGQRRREAAPCGAQAGRRRSGESLSLRQAKKARKRALFVCRKRITIPKQHKIFPK